MRITLADVRSIPVPGRKPGYCVAGCRLFAERYGLDIKAFAREGIEADVLLSTGDAMAAHIVEHVKKMRENHG
jgi:hypothetical protein